MGNGSKLLHRRACSFARKFPTAGAVLVAFVVREPVENASLTKVGESKALIRRHNDWVCQDDRLIVNSSLNVAEQLLAT